MIKPVCALIGGGEGLGRALAAKFATEGMDVALLSRSEEGSAAALAAAQAAGARARYFPADATRPETLEQALDAVTGEMGEVDCLIYNARGPYELRAPLEMSYADLEEIFRLEVVGAYAAAKRVMPAMLERGRGSVLFSSATAAFRGSATNPLYAIGKFGLRALAQSLAKAYAANGVHVVHVRLDCTLDVPEVRDWYGDDFDKETTADCDDVAESYWWVHTQPRSAWTNELELRPYTETWTF